MASIEIERDGKSYQASIEVVTLDRAIVNVYQGNKGTLGVPLAEDVIVRGTLLRTLAQNVIGTVNRAIASERAPLHETLDRINKSIAEGLA